MPNELVGADRANAVVEQLPRRRYGTRWLGADRANAVVEQREPDDPFDLALHPGFLALALYGHLKRRSSPVSVTWPLVSGAPILLAPHLIRRLAVGGSACRSNVMQSSGGRTRPAGPGEMIPYVDRACSELGYLNAAVTPGLAYVIWAQWHEDDAPQVFRALGHRIKREVLVERGILPQTVLTHEAWAAMTDAGRAVGPVQTYIQTIRRASGLWLEDYKVRNPRWVFAFKRAQESAAALAA